LSSDFARPSAGEPPPHRACNDVFQQLHVLQASALEHYKAARGSCGGRLLVIELFLSLVDTLLLLGRAQGLALLQRG
jgi:hypothetical protein